MTAWQWFIVGYLVAAAATAVPILSPLFGAVKPHPGGDSFADATHLSEDSRRRLQQHFTRIAGTLGFWKNQATLYKRLHYYSLFWTIPTGIAVPILAQLITADDPWSKWAITIVAGFSGLLLTLHQALKVEGNYRAFRIAESDFYDLYRRMLDSPETFGRTEQIQVKAYLKEVEFVRRRARDSELNNVPSIASQVPRGSSTAPALPEDPSE